MLKHKTSDEVNDKILIQFNKILFIRVIIHNYHEFGNAVHTILINQSYLLVLAYAVAILINTSVIQMAESL